MNFRQRLKNIWLLSSRSIENPKVPISLAGITSMPTATGISVNEEISLSFSAVWACVRAISSDIGSLPFNIYERDGRGKILKTDHPYFTLIHSEPNELMTINIFLESLIANALLWGDGFAMIKRKGIYIDSFELWQSKDTRVEQSENGGLFYTNEKLNRKKIPARDMIHIPGLSFDGICGKSPIMVARENVSLGLALQEFGGSFFGNGANLNGVLEHPGTLGETARKNLLESWQSRYGGVKNANKTAVLEEGMKYNSIGIPPEDAQFLGTRKFSIEEIARIYRVPLHKIGNLDRSTNNNIEQQAIEYVTDTLKGWVVRIEKEFDRKIFFTSEKDKLFTKLNMNSLLRGDVKSRGEWYAKGRQWGWFSENDIRQLEDMNPIPNGDNYLVPLNMTTVDKIGMNGKGNEKDIKEVLKELKENNHG